MGKDHTLFALKDGKVSFSQKRQIKFDNTTIMKKVINVI
jgi:ribosomal protein L27